MSSQDTQDESGIRRFQVINASYLVATALAIMFGGQILTDNLTMWPTVVGAGIWLALLPFTKEPEVSRRYE
jgi:uncharacterized membrane protein YcaP (DUF421 family)